MATARRILAGIYRWSSGRRIDLSTRANPHRPYVGCNQNRHLSTNTDHDYIRDIDVVDLLSAPGRDFLYRNRCQKVPVSSLKGRLVGLYLCERVAPHGTRVEVIKKVYEEAKSRGFDFEIVQITFDFNAIHSGNPIMQLIRRDVSWLTLPSLEPNLEKILSIFEYGDLNDGYWAGDSLVLIHPPEADADDATGDSIALDFSGMQILERWGIEGYPFTRKALYRAEYELQKREVTLQSFFPPGECLLRRPRPAGDGFDLVDASQLSGKRVLVLFAPHSFDRLAFSAKFLWMLQSVYLAQQNGDVAKECRYEVVYVSTGFDVSSFDKFVKDMPWLVLPFDSQLNLFARLLKLFKPRPKGAVGVAFNEKGELIAKEDFLNRKEVDNLQFPFIDQDLEKRIRAEVEELCNFG